MLRIKDNSIQAHSLAPQLLLAIFIADQVFAERASECVITALADGSHSSTSLHYAGCAVDLRTRHLGPGHAQIIHKELRGRLNMDWDVLLEPDHIHIEYQPKRRG